MDPFACRARRSDSCQSHRAIARLESSSGLQNFEACRKPPPLLASSTPSLTNRAPSPALRRGLVVAMGGGTKASLPFAVAGDPVTYFTLQN